MPLGCHTSHAWVPHGCHVPHCCIVIELKSEDRCHFTRLRSTEERLVQAPFETAFGDEWLAQA